MALTKLYTKTPFALDRFITEVLANTNITVALDLTTTTSFGDQVTIGFKTDLADWSYVDALIAAHAGVALPQNAIQPVVITSQPDPVPFAQPTYRTKRDASDWVECLENVVTDLDFLLTSERYVSGGDLIFKDAKEGDYITASVYDAGSVIPSPYRAALCEAWPIVATYIVKMYLMPVTGYSKFTIDTYPLNAKISAGLYLRVSYHATADAGTRKMVVNYHLTKKL